MYKLDPEYTVEANRIAMLLQDVFGFSKSEVDGFDGLFDLFEDSPTVHIYFDSLEQLQNDFGEHLGYIFYRIMKENQTDSLLVYIKY